MTNPLPNNTDDQLDEILATEPHRVGSHSDDWGGDSDNPCYCTVKQKMKQLLVNERIDELEQFRVPKKWERGYKPTAMNGHNVAVNDMNHYINNRIKHLKENSGVSDE